MATVTTGYTFVNNETVTPSKLNSLAGSATVTAIVDADISSSAAIADTKIATIATAGKVSNNATTATSANTASAIVSRDSSGNFSAGTITATTVTGSGNSSFSGNVGIGTSSPNAKIEAIGPNLGTVIGNTSEIARFNANNGNQSILRVYLKRYASGSDWTTAETRIQQTIDVSSQAYISFNRTGGGIAFGTTETDRLCIDPNGTISSQGNPITNCPTTAKAWGGGSSAGVIESLTFGVSTITRTALGNYLITMSTAINGYSIVTSPNTSAGAQSTAQVVSTTQFRVYTFGGGGAAADFPFKFAVFGV